MSTIAKLKLISSKPQRHLTPVQVRRNKLSTKLWEQLQIAQAQREGKQYTATRWRTFTNTERLLEHLLFDSRWRRLGK